MTNKRDFFALLRAKIEKSPDRNFDQRFWNQFESEFGATEQPSVASRLRWLVFRPAFVSAIAFVFAILLLSNFSRNRSVDSLNQAMVAEAQSEPIQNQVLFLDLEVFQTLDDVAELSDSDWRILLET